MGAYLLSQEKGGIDSSYATEYGYYCNLVDVKYYNPPLKNGDLYGSRLAKVGHTD
jgi:hypothetical protein